MVPRVRIAACAMNGIASCRAAPQRRTSSLRSTRAVPGHRADAQRAALARDVTEIAQSR